MTQQTLRRQEQHAAEVAGQRLEALHSKLPVAERAMQDVESDLARLRTRGEELEGKCTAQRIENSDLQQKRDINSATLARLRDELQRLTTQCSKLQSEVDAASLERTRLETEVEVATPALQDLRHRCKELEERLAARVQELGLEAEKVRRCRAETEACRARIGVLERHNTALGSKLHDYGALGPSPERVSPPRVSPPSQTRTVEFSRNRGYTSSPLEATRGIAASPRLEEDQCVCGATFMPSSVFCLMCGSRRQGYQRSLDRPADVSRHSPLRRDVTRDIAASPRLEDQCVCGHIFISGSRFCRVCGTRRQAMSQVLHLRPQQPPRPQPHPEQLRPERRVHFVGGDHASSSAYGRSVSPDRYTPSSPSALRHISSSPGVGRAVIHSDGHTGIPPPMPNARLSLGDSEVRFLCDFVAREEERLGIAPHTPPSALGTWSTPLNGHPFK